MKEEKSNFSRRLDTGRAFGFSGNESCEKIRRIANHFDKTSGTRVTRTEYCSVVENMQNA